MSAAVFRTPIVAMLVLVAVALLGLGATRIVLLDERALRAERDRLIARQAAEAALVDAEIDIAGPGARGVPDPRANSRTALFDAANAAVFVDGCGSAPAGPASNLGLCRPAPAGAAPVWESVDFLDDGVAARSVAYGTFTGQRLSAGPGGVRPERAPRYVIEALPDPAPGGDASRPALLYRVSALGFGPSAEVRVLLQTVVRKID